MNRGGVLVTSRSVVIGWVLAFSLGMALSWWAIGATFARPELPDAERQQSVLYEVQAGMVQDKQSFTAAAAWSLRDAAWNSATGTVTQVTVAPGQEVHPGDVLYSVNLRPVVIAEGTVPAFRDMQVGTIGADVLQLEQMLARVTPFSGTVDNTFTSTTSAAVAAWQRDLGTSVTGRVSLGDVVFLSKLPQRIVLGDQIAVGQRLAAGTVPISVLSAAPEFTVTLDMDQRALVSLDGDVRVRADDQVWRGMIRKATESPEGELVLTLAAADGGPLCGRRCDSVPVSERTLMPCEIVSVPRTQGPVVPNAALGTAPDGSTVVIRADGSEAPVRVLASANGSSVVSGIEAGDRVRLFGQGSTPAEN